jgi:anti-sigma regulatory factor (Ser/Thr protein kinase)
MVTPHPGDGARGRASIAIANDRSAVATVVTFVERFCAERDLGSALAARLAVVLEELLTNTLAYAYGDTRRHEVTIALEAGDGAVTVTYEDDGRPFDPFAVAPPSFETPVEEWPIGRLGIHLIRYLTDRFSYVRAGERNRITLVKAIPEAGAS